MTYHRSRGLLARAAAALLLGLAAAAQAAPCSWARPGGDRYTGTVEAAIRSYHQIPPYTRGKLVRMWQTRTGWDHVVITRDKIVGQHEYVGLREMHFGDGRRCEWPDRSAWQLTDQEGAVALTADGVTVIVPAVCGNVSLADRITLAAAAPAAPPAPAEPALPSGGSGAPPAAQAPTPVATAPVAAAPAPVPAPQGWAPMTPVMHDRAPIWTPPPRPVFHKPPCLVRCNPKPPKCT